MSRRTSRVRHLAWAAGAAGLGFAVAFVFGDVLRLPVDLFAAVHAAAVFAFSALYVARTGWQWRRWCARRWGWALLLGLAGGAALVRGVLREAATPSLSGPALWRAMALRGVLYGLADGVLLLALPWVIARRAIRGRVKSAAVGWPLAIAITTVYHLGYADFRSRRILLPNVGTTIGLLPTLLAANPLASPVSHVALHVAAVLHCPDSGLFLPPHAADPGTRPMAPGAGAASDSAMAETMRAFVMRRIGEVGWMEKPVPDPGPEDAVVKTTAALVCTSDTHTLAGAIGERKDLTLGHEAVGVIAKLGSAVRGFSEGQRVLVGAITPCFRCTNCQRGYTSQCRGMLGGWKFANEKDGSFAEYFHVNAAEANLAPIPDTLTDEQAVYCADMLSTGLAAAENAELPIGGSVAIFSQGPVGLMATAGARLRGAGLIIAIETVENRKQLARFYGADQVIDFREHDPVDAIRSLTNGDGVDGAIEALGSPETFAACVKATRPGGTISNVGYHGEGDTVPIPRAEWGVGMSDKTIRTALCPGGAVRMRRLMRLIEADRIDPTPMTTHRVPFAEIERAFRLMRTKEENIVKPLVTFA